MVSELSDGKLEVKLIDFNVSRSFRDKDTSVKYMM